jgi:hypothetical protein
VQEFRKRTTFIRSGAFPGYRPDGKAGMLCDALDRPEEDIRNRDFQILAA